MHNGGGNAFQQDTNNNKKLKLCVLVYGVCALVVAVILLIAPVTATYQNHNASKSLILSPGDTLITSCNGAYSQGFSVGNEAAAVSSSLYLLQNAPMLDAKNSFVISSTTTVGKMGDYQHWNFHLYPGSTYSLQACLNTGYLVEYYIIKGTSNYNHWAENPSSVQRVQKFLTSGE